MWNRDSDRPQGYEYPPPSIEGGQTQETTTTPKPLSPENVRKIRDTIRRNEERGTAEALAVHSRC